MVGRDAKPLADQDQRRSRDPVGALLVSLQLLECDPELRQALPGTCSAAAGIPECGRLSLDQCPWSGLSNSVSCSPFHCSKFRILPSIDPRLGSSSTREPRILGRPGGGSDEEAGRIEALGKAAAHHLEHSPSLNAASAFALARNPFIRPFWRYRWLRQQLAMSILLSIRLATIIGSYYNKRIQSRSRNGFQMAAKSLRIGLHTSQRYAFPGPAPDHQARS